MNTDSDNTHVTFFLSVHFDTAGVCDEYLLEVTINDIVKVDFDDFNVLKRLPLEDFENLKLAVEYYNQQEKLHISIHVVRDSGCNIVKKKILDVEHLVKSGEQIRLKIEKEEAKRKEAGEKAKQTKELNKMKRLAKELGVPLEEIIKLRDKEV